MANFLTFFNEIIVKNHQKIAYFTLKIAKKMQLSSINWLISVYFYRKQSILSIIIIKIKKMMIVDNFLMKKVI